MKPKYLYIYLLSLIIINLSSCEHLGVEVSTVKGKWVSEKTNGQNIFLNISNHNTYSSETFLNDSIQLIKESGTWVLRNDTLFLYHQNFENKGVKRLLIEQLSMNLITLRNLKNGDIIVLNRVYSGQNLDYDDRFAEVFNLKGGFWWYAWIITLIALIILIIIGGIMSLIGIIGNIPHWIRKIKRKNNHE